MLIALFCLKRNEKSGFIVFGKFIIYYSLAESPLKATYLRGRLYQKSHITVAREFMLIIFSQVSNANEQMCLNMRNALTGFSLII